MCKLLFLISQLFVFLAIDLINSCSLPESKHNSDRVLMLIFELAFNQLFICVELHEVCCVLQGSHLSLLHKADPIGNSNVQKTIRSVGASASVPYGQTTVVDGSVNSRNNASSSGSAASAFIGEESKQAAMSRKLTAAVEQLYQSPDVRSHESIGNWFSSGNSAPAKSYVLQNFHLNSGSITIYINFHNKILYSLLIHDFLKKVF